MSPLTRAKVIDVQLELCVVAAYITRHVVGDQ